MEKIKLKLKNKIEKLKTYIKRKIAVLKQTGKGNYIIGSLSVILFLLSTGFFIRSSKYVTNIIDFKKLKHQKENFESYWKDYYQKELQHLRKREENWKRYKEKARIPENIPNDTLVYRKIKNLENESEKIKEKIGNEAEFKQKTLESISKGIEISKANLKSVREILTTIFSALGGILTIVSTYKLVTA